MFKATWLVLEFQRRPAGQDLQSIVSAIKAVLLDAEERSASSNSVKDCLEKLKDALYDADDILDDIQTEALRKDLMRGNKLTKEVRLFFSSSNQFSYGLKMGRKIKDIKARLSSIQNETKMFNLVEPDHSVETPFMAKRRQQTHSFVHDIWNEEREQWFSLKKLLMGGAKGSRIIVTTRSHRIAKITSRCQPHVLKGLSDDDAWFLFKEIAFEQRSAESSNSTFVDIGKQILKVCGGVPLVIRAIAGTLSFKETENEWLSFKDNELSRISQNGGEILPTLKGFVKQSNSSQSLEEDGFRCFKGLVERSFFQEVKEYGDRDIACKMHDLMHDLAEIVAEGETCILDSDSSASLNAVPDSIHKLKHLRYLDLFFNENVKILPKSICKTQNLQVLKLDRCYQLEELPKKIEKLVNLTHLRCDGCWRITHMPCGIGKLTSLKTLSMFVVDKDGSHGAAAADLSELGGLNNLRGRLEITNLGFVKNAKVMFEAANLKEKQHLRSLVLLWSGAAEEDEEKSLEDLQPHPNLKELYVVGWRGDAKFPSWLSLLTNLTDIVILGPSKFKHLPSFAQLPHLKVLWIEELTELEYMDDNCPIGGHGEPQPFFPSLTHLELRQCPNMKSWWKTPVDSDKHTTVVGASTKAFPCLSGLFIKDCPLASMPLYPSLEVLRLVNTSSRTLKQTIQMNITQSTSSLPLSKLKLFSVKNIEELAMPDEYLKNLTSLEDLSIDSFHWLKSLSGWLQLLASLKTLTITDCKELDLEGMQLQWDLLKINLNLSIDNIPQLLSLPLWLQHLVQLKSLRIENCSGLRSLFPVFQHLTSLEEFRVSNCKELELSVDDIQIFQDYKSLRLLHLENIPMCQHLPEWLQHLTKLQKLHLYDLPNLTSLPDEVRSLTSLEELYIREIPKVEERCRKDIGVDWHKIAYIPSILAYILQELTHSSTSISGQGPADVVHGIMVGHHWCKEYHVVPGIFIIWRLIVDEISMDFFMSLGGIKSTHQRVSVFMMQLCDWLFLCKRVFIQSLLRKIVRGEFMLYVSCTVSSVVNLSLGKALQMLVSHRTA
ncbi:hypothetical protein V6N11_078947 [Hibiscus sabdariffa]|uniref:Uncharacterized protein n=1 Tax=Hibiscus sabdariffa TaxID=183260 RepID=A0ABR2RUH6_9ROSI